MAPTRTMPITSGIRLQFTSRWSGRRLEIRRGRECPLIGPIIGGGYKTLPDGIVADVSPFLAEAFIAPESVVEKVALPNNPCFACEETFPVSDGLWVPGVFWKRHQCVEMIRHQQKEVDPPCTRGLLMNQGRFNGNSSAGQSELVLPARSTVDRDEEDGAITHPGRHFMWQCLANTARQLPNRWRSRVHSRDRR